ncbi:Uncharacterized protein BM_BM1398 [Brugia malayi]|nr:Uncharacterized protein BM_BM1398 [Brugia malayi]VIO93145.1 Uncharacterized protein BM_BM1398 [Brugia malayi]
MAFFERFQLHALFRLLLLTVIAASNPKFIMCGQKNYIYCWWAVDIIDVSKSPILYQNGKSVMIENNIKKLCSETKEGRYGISYVDIKILSNNE